MLLRIMTIIFLSMLITAPLLLAAEPTSTGDAKKMTAGKKAEEVGNRVCPVSGDKIKAGEEVKFEYEGKIYNFCCKMCIKDFKKNPQKYIKLLQEMDK